MLELSDYIEKSTKKGGIEEQKFDEKELEKIFTTDKKNHYDYYIIIGSSCINPAAEQLMIKLYSHVPEESKGKFEFRTFHKYKSRSNFWTLKEGTYNKEEIGIFYKEGNKEERIGEPDENNKGEVIKDTAFLIICSGNYVDKNIKGDIILLSGFHKYGTFELSRMLSRVNVETRKEEEAKRIKKYKEMKIKGKTFSVENFFLKVNEIVTTQPPDVDLFTTETTACCIFMQNKLVFW